MGISNFICPYAEKLGKLLIPESFCEEAPSATKVKNDPSDQFIASARHWEKLEELRVRCVLCPKECRVADQERGYCGVRENHKGEYKTLVYSRPCSIAVDPIEKKPLFHFLPNSLALSIATAGCNMECKFCQNWEISQFRPEQIKSTYFTPENVAEAAVNSGSKVIAYTYTEPVIFYEYMFDSAICGNKKNIASVMISNGYIKEKPLRELCRVLSGIKIDLKAFTEKFYKEMCSGELKPVLRTLEILKEENMWFEIVVLIVPTLNDSVQENKEMCQWIVKTLGPDVPVHFSRFHPIYKVKNLPPTPVKTIETIRKIAIDEGCHFVYVGNVSPSEGEKTFCPNCKQTLISRIGLYIERNIIQNGQCPKCKTKIPGIWTESDLPKKQV